MAPESHFSPQNLAEGSLSILLYVQSGDQRIFRWEHKSKNVGAAGTIRSRGHAYWNRVMTRSPHTGGERLSVSRPPTYLGNFYGSSTSFCHNSHNLMISSIDEVNMAFKCTLCCVRLVFLSSSSGARQAKEVTMMGFGEFDLYILL
jgi:hypothetical protein